MSSGAAAGANPALGKWEGEPISAPELAHRVEIIDGGLLDSIALSLPREYSSYPCASFPSARQGRIWL